MDHSDSDKADGGTLSPALVDLIKAKATGQADTSEVSLPTEVLRIRQKLGESNESAGNRTDERSEEGPDRFIGPRNPHHPHVNRDGGGRDPA